MLNIHHILRQKSSTGKRGFLRTRDPHYQANDFGNTPICIERARGIQNTQCQQWVRIPQLNKGIATSNLQQEQDYFKIF